MPALTKICTRCQDLGRPCPRKPISRVMSQSAFHLGKNSPDGFQRWCKLCSRESKRDAYHHRTRQRFLRLTDASTPSAPIESPVSGRKTDTALIVKPSRLIEARHRDTLIRRLFKAQRGLCANCAHAETARDEAGRVVSLVLHGGPGSPLVFLLCNHCTSAATALRHSPTFAHRLGDLLERARVRSGPREEIALHTDDPYVPEVEA